MLDKISGKFHPIPSTIANQRWISIRNIIICLETKCRPNRRIFYLAAILYLGYHGNGRHFGGFFNPQKLPHTMVDIPTKWIIIWLPNHGYQFPTSKSTWKQNRRIFVFGGHFVPWLPWQWPPFWFFFNPPKAVTYYGEYSYKVDHNMAPESWISIPNIKIYLETKFRPNRRIFVFRRPFWKQRWISIRNIIIYLET